MAIPNYDTVHEYTLHSCEDFVHRIPVGTVYVTPVLLVRETYSKKSVGMLCETPDHAVGDLNRRGSKIDAGRRDDCGVNAKGIVWDPLSWLPYPHTIENCLGIGDGLFQECSFGKKSCCPFSVKLSQLLNKGLGEGILIEDVLGNANFKLIADFERQMVDTDIFKKLVREAPELFSGYELLINVFED